MTLADPTADPASLQGSIADANTPWLAKLLYSRGVDLVRVECVPDDKAGEVIEALACRARLLVAPEWVPGSLEDMAAAVNLAMSEAAPTLPALNPSSRYAVHDPIAQTPDIQETVKRLRQRVGDTGFVFTSGGEQALLRMQARD